jgi:hypothetical protein
VSLGRSVGRVCSISTHLGLLCLSSALPCPCIPPLSFRKLFVCGDWSTFPECFWALSSGRTTARAATKVHDKDLSLTKLRVSARRTPLCDLRSPALLCAVCLFRSSLLSLCWRCFCRWFCCVLYSLRVLLCPPPLASASALVFSSARSLVAVVCGSGGGVAVGAWSRLWDRRRRPVVAAVGRRRFALLIFLLELKRRVFPSGFASGRLRSPPVASGRLRSPPVASGRLRSTSLA